MTQIIPTGAPTSTSTAMVAGLARLWVKFLPEIEQRLTILESAVGALAAATLFEEQRKEAHAAAHKLAGILGTFGLQHGTELARQSEQLLVEGISEEDSERLSSWIEELREVVNARKASS